MIAQIKRPTEKKASIDLPGVKVQAKDLMPKSRMFYTTLLLLFFVAVAIIFSLRSNQLFLKELSVSGLILCYVFAMLHVEGRSKQWVNNSIKRPKMNSSKGFQ